MKTILSISVVLLLMVSLISSTPKKDKNEKWVQLFNGKDLKDWNIKFAGHDLGDNYKNTFRVEDGLLKVRYDNWGNFEPAFGHIFYKGVFSHYKLHVEYRFVGEQVQGGPAWAMRNNGLMLHGQSAESMEIDQSFPVSIEVQLLGGNGKDHRSNMNLCTPGTNVVLNGELEETHCIDSDSETYHGDQWVSVSVEVKGGEIVNHYIDNKLVMTYEKPQYDPKDKDAKKMIPEDGNLIISKGTISLQAESAPIDFRKVEILVLKK